MTDPTQRRVVCPQCGWIGRRRGKVAGDCPRCPRGTQVAWSERGVGRPTDVVGIPRGKPCPLLAKRFPIHGGGR